MTLTAVFSAASPFLSRAASAFLSMAFLATPFSAWAHVDVNSLGQGCGGDCEEAQALAVPMDPTPGAFETYPDGSEPKPATDPEFAPAGVTGPVAPAAGQPQGALSGRIVYTSGGHGWTNGSGWFLQRPLLLEMNEDYGNFDQMTMFAHYAFNAGATVVTFRPVGHQVNEVVVDNVDPEVTWSGDWNDSSESVYYGNQGETPYRWAELSSTETATATYVPDIPETGFYPVYTWARSGNQRTFQLYRIRHTGGESEVRVPHHMVGNGWVYLGTYYFNAGANSDSGAVIISNLQPSPAVGSVVIADAIRFGNGMSEDGSTYPKEEEASRYWVKNSLGHGQPSSIYDLSGFNDNSDNVGAPIRMAREMNNEAVGSFHDRIYLGYHSNATTGNPDTAAARGAIGLYNTTASRRTPNQQRWAAIVGREVQDQMLAMNPFLEVPWHNRGNGITYGATFGEINNETINNAFDATIIEVAFHDNRQDALLLRDPKVRNWVARASYRAVLKYMNEFDDVPLDFLPEPPRNVRAIATESGDIEVSWDVPLESAGSGDPAGYRVYRSTNGYGFGNPVEVEGGAATSVTLTDLPGDSPLYFRVAATNAGGESLPSETVGTHRVEDSGKPRVLYVNGYERFDRTINIRQSPAPGNYRAPGHDGNGGNTDRIIPRSVNSFDYVVQHGEAIAAAGLAFDSGNGEAIANDQIDLGDYDIVVWGAGQDSVDEEPFDTAQQSRVAAYIEAGGSFFVSGSEVAYALDRSSGPSEADRAFLRETLRVRYSTDDTNSYVLTPRDGTIFEGLPNVVYDDGPLGIYPVRSPDRVLRNGDGTEMALLYSGGAGGPGAVQYDGSVGGGRVVYMAFPFETIADAGVREQYMASILGFLWRGGFELWQEEHFTEAELQDPAISGPHADPVGSGIPNILKFAFGIGPWDTSRERLPEVWLEGGTLRFSYWQSLDALDSLDFVVEVSENLFDWREAGDEVEIVETVEVDGARRVELENTVPAEEGRRFVRLRVEGM